MHEKRAGNKAPALPQQTEYPIHLYDLTPANAKVLSLAALK
jgi:hypothetical protein